MIKNQRGMKPSSMKSHQTTREPAHRRFVSVGEYNGFSIRQAVGSALANALGYDEPFRAIPAD
jgi:hypothetical protein